MPTLTNQAQSQGFVSRLRSYACGRSARECSLLRKEMHGTEGLEVLVTHPLATLFAQFLTERRYLKNVTDRTLVWYRVAFTNYQRVIGADAPALPTRAALQRLVVALRDRGVRPVTCNRAMFTDILDFCARVLANQGARGRSMNCESDPGSVLPSTRGIARGPVLPAVAFEAHECALGTAVASPEVTRRR